MPRGCTSSNKQAEDLVYGSGLVAGQAGSRPRHEIKQELLAAGVSGSHNIAQHTTISRGQARTYINDYKQAFSWLKGQGIGFDDKGRWDIKNLTAADLGRWLENKAEVNDDGKAISAKTLSNYISAVEKLNAFLPRSRGFELQGLHDVCVGIRKNVLPELHNVPKVTRAYNNPDAVLSHLHGKDALASELMKSCGLRVDNALHFRLESDGTISFVSKGGMPHEHYRIPSDLYNRAIEYNGGKVGACNLGAYRTYISHLKDACAAAGEKYSGAHSWRHTYARTRFSELCASGMGEKRAKAIVSEELFHRRLDIVNEYLR